MPTRLLYEKITVSVTLAELTAEEERFFYRLLVKCDDHGRFHAHPAILLGHCFSLQSSKITVEDVLTWRQRLEDVGLIRTYAVEGREYLTVSAWKAYQRQRASSSKYPDPPFREQLRADVREERQIPPGAGDVKRGPKAGTRGPGAGARAAGPRIAPPSSAPPGSPPEDDFEKTPPPEHLEPTDTEYRLGETLGLSRGQVDQAAVAMLDRYRSKGERRADWLSTLRGWLRNAAKYDRPAAGSAANGIHAPPSPPASKAPVSYLYDESTRSNDAT